MGNIRKIQKIFKSKPTMEGAGVRLKRAFGEPVAWYGPIVINTQEELRIAFEEYENGTFIRRKK